jgi:hypothetical protein
MLLMPGTLGERESDSERHIEHRDNERDYTITLRQPSRYLLPRNPPHAHASAHFDIPEMSVIGSTFFSSSGLIDAASALFGSRLFSCLFTMAAVVE